MVVPVMHSNAVTPSAQTSREGCTARWLPVAQARVASGAVCVSVPDTFSTSPTQRTHGGSSRNRSRHSVCPPDEQTRPTTGIYSSKKGSSTGRGRTRGGYKAKVNEAPRAVVLYEHHIVRLEIAMHAAARM